MRPLILSDEAREQILKVIEHAEANRMGIDHVTYMAELYRELGSDARGLDDDPRFRVIIPVDYRCGFTIEEQPDPLGWCRHLSILVPDKRRVAHPLAVAEISKLFGFRDPLGKAQFIAGHAVNLLEPLEPANP